MSDLQKNRKEDVNQRDIVYDSPIPEILSPVLKSWGVLKLNDVGLYRIPTGSDIFDENPMSSIVSPDIHVELLAPLVLLAYYNLYCSDIYLPKEFKDVKVEEGKIYFPCHCTENHIFFSNYITSFLEELDVYQSFKLDKAKTPFDVYRYRFWLNNKINTSLSDRCIGFHFGNEFYIFSWNNPHIDLKRYFESYDQDNVDEIIKNSYLSWVEEQNLTGKQDVISYLTPEELSAKELMNSIFTTYPGMKARSFFSDISMRQSVLLFGKNVATTNPFSVSDIIYTKQKEAYFMGFMYSFSYPTLEVSGTVTSTRRFGTINYFVGKRRIVDISSQFENQTHLVQKAWNKGNFLSPYQKRLFSLFSVLPDKVKTLIIMSIYEFNIFKVNACCI
jgi:hypothetical protein